MISIQVVRGFMDMFSIDLPSMPSDRPIDFAINVESSTKSISIPPYRMDLVELKKLKQKLQNLLSKGFI